MVHAPRYRLSFWLSIIAYIPLGYALAQRGGLLGGPGWPAPDPGQIIAYGAILLAFLAGGRWGGAITRAELRPWPFLGGWAIAALGVVAVFAEYRLGLALLLLGFAAQGGWDVMAAYAGHWPRTMIGQRRLLAFAVSLTLIGLFALG